MYFLFFCLNFLELFYRRCWFVVGECWMKCYFVYNNKSSEIFYMDFLVWCVGFWILCFVFVFFLKNIEIYFIVDNCMINIKFVEGNFLKRCGLFVL